VENKLFFFAELVAIE